MFIHWYLFKSIDTHRFTPASHLSHKWQFVPLEIILQVYKAAYSRAKNAENLLPAAGLFIMFINHSSSVILKKKFKPAELAN